MKDLDKKLFDITNRLTEINSDFLELKKDIYNFSNSGSEIEQSDIDKINTDKNSLSFEYDANFLEQPYKAVGTNSEIEYMPFINFIRLCNLSLYRRSDWFMALSYCDELKCEQSVYDAYWNIKKNIHSEKLLDINLIDMFNIENLFCKHSQEYLRNVLDSKTDKYLTNWEFKFNNRTFNEFYCEIIEREDHYISSFFEYKNKYSISEVKNCDDEPVVIEVSYDPLYLLPSYSNRVKDIIVELRIGDLSTDYEFYIPSNFKYSLEKDITEYKVEKWIEKFGSYCTREYLKTIESLFTYFPQDSINVEYLKHISKGLLD